MDPALRMKSAFAQLPGEAAQLAKCLQALGCIGTPRSTVMRPGWAPGKQRINIGNEKLPTTGKAIRSLIRARYIDGNRCGPGSAQRGARHVSNLLGSRWKGEGHGGLGNEDPTPGSEGGQGPKNQREKPADSSRAGSGEASSGAHGEGEPLGLRVGPAWSSAPCLSARGVWRGPAGPWVCSCLPAVLSRQDECPACQMGPALHGGSTPFLSSAGHVPLASPFSARRGDRACRSGSSEGSVLSRGRRWDE